MSLVRAEARRLTKRRFTRLMLVLMVLLLGAIVVSMSIASKKAGPEVRAKAEAAAQAEYEQQLTYHRQMVADCEAAKARGENITDRFPPDCGAQYAPTRENFNAEWYMPFEFQFRELFEIFIAVFAGVLALFAYLVGASYVGAEWNTGGMTNLLLWRPRRIPVLLTKLGVLLGGVLVTGLTLGALWTLALWLVGRYDGRLGRLTSGVWQSFAISGARGLGLALAVAAVGFGLASIGRHTATALGVAVGIGVVVEIGLRIGLRIASVPFPDRFVLTTYALSWFTKKYTMFDYQACNVNLTGECKPTEFTLTWQHSALVFGIGTVLVLVAAFWTMRRRDIT